MKAVRQKPVSLTQELKRNRGIYLMALPVLLYYLVFKYFPLPGLSIAFMRYNLFRGFRGSTWAGFDHFVRFMTGPYFWRLIRNTFLINFYSLLFAFPMPIVFALMINEVRAKNFKKTLQTISYMPHFISLVVVCGMLKDFCRTDGLFNSILSVFGHDAVDLLTRPELFRSLYIGSNVWQAIGWSSIIYIATLSTVDPNLYEAAEIDGAGRLGRIIYISLPALVPIITIQLIMRIGHILSEGFEKIILLYNPLTYETADVISSYTYRYGLEQANYSFGTAVGIFNSVVNITILVLVNGFFKRFTEESLW